MLGRIAKSHFVEGLDFIYWMHVVVYYAGPGFWVIDLVSEAGKRITSV
jgi:hypothetical protein